MKNKFIFLSLFLLTALSSTGCLVKTSETEIGIKIKKFSIFDTKGVQEEIYAPGRYHFYIPFFQEFRKFDTKVQTMSMTFNPQTGDERHQDDILFKTIDGNDISLDVIFQYRIIGKMAPQIVQYVAEDDYRLKKTLMRAVTRSIPRDIFGELKTEEFYKASKREEKSDKVKKALNEVLEPLGIVVETVLTKDYRFNQAYQKAIEDKKVADQQAEKNKSATEASRAEYAKKLQDTQGQVNEMIAQVDGEFLKAKIEADAYYEKMKQIAQAVEAEGIAQAKGIKKLNEALAGAGGRTMVKLEIAKNLKDKKIFLLPLSGETGGLNLKTTNVNDLLNLYGIKKLSEE